MASVPFVDLALQFSTIEGEAVAAVEDILRSGAYVLGPKVEEFESKFSEEHGCKYGVAVNSGTSALHLALIALGVSRGHEVITTSATFIATAAAISYVGATPVFVDIDPITNTIDVERVRASITPNTRAVIPVHLYGVPADLNALRTICDDAGIALLEDAAQAHGATYFGKPVGSFGAAGCFSFYPGKNIGGVGEGGILITNHKEIYDRCRRLRDWGQTERYHHSEIGFNYRMDAIQAAVLLIKLKKMRQWIEKRRSNAKFYATNIQSTKVRLPLSVEGRESVFHVFPVLSPDRDALSKHLASNGIGHGFHYPIPVHLQGAYREFHYSRGSLPVAEALSACELSLPIYPELTHSQMQRVVETVNAF